MASLFDEIDAAGQAVIADRLGEAVAIVGMLDGEYSRSTDPDRQQQSATAVVALSPRVGKVAEGLLGRSSTGANRAHMNNEIWMSSTDFGSLAWEPVKGDRLITGQGTQAERCFSIMAVLPMEQGDVQILLNEDGESA